MYPNMNYGQIVRGPGPSGSSGTWTGILDLRGLVKVVNGILIMKDMHSPDWTSTREQSMNIWMSQYAKWLTESSLGKDAASHLKYVTISLAVSNRMSNSSQQSCIFLCLAGCCDPVIRW